MPPCCQGSRFLARKTTILLEFSVIRSLKILQVNLNIRSGSALDFHPLPPLAGPAGDIGDPCRVTRWKSIPVFYQFSMVHLAAFNLSKIQPKRVILDTRERNVPLWRGRGGGLRGGWKIEKSPGTFDVPPPDPRQRGTSAQHVVLQSGWRKIPDDIRTVNSYIKIKHRPHQTTTSGIVIGIHHSHCPMKIGSKVAVQGRNRSMLRSKNQAEG
jgi:hypothetical protein